MADLPSAQSSSAVYDRLLKGEATSEEYVAALKAEVQHASRHRPTDRPDAYCVDCPFSDRGDWVMYRAEYEALKEAEAERDRYRKALLRIWVGDTGPAESIQQFAFWAVHPPEGSDA